jgi:hypothetical protein
VITVHIIQAGRAICGRPDRPSDWPEGEMWAGFEVKPESLLGTQSLCSKCAERRKAMVKPKGR